MESENGKQRNKIPADLPLPAYSREWQEGWKAFEEGTGKESCPYVAQTEAIKYNRWMRGWAAHEYQNAK